MTNDIYSNLQDFQYSRSGKLEQDQWFCEEMMGLLKNAEERKQWQYKYIYLITHFCARTPDARDLVEALHLPERFPFTSAGDCVIMDNDTGELNLDNGTARINANMSLPEGENVNHRQRLCIGGKEQWVTYKSAQELVDIASAQAGSNQNKEKSVCFKDYAENWVRTCKVPKLGEHTVEGLVSKLKLHIYPYIGDKCINDIRMADVQTVVSSCVSASSAKWAKSIVNEVIAAAITDEIYTHPNPTKDKRIVMPTKKETRRGLTKEECKIVMDTLPRLPEDEARLLVLMFMTGCRRSEALGARWEDIDWSNSTIHLQRVVRFRKGNQPIVSEKMKTPAANRTISLWPEFVPYLGEVKSAGFIIECDGEPLSDRRYRTIWEHIQKCLNEAGLKERFTSHQLRHTYATVAANSGKVPMKVLQNMLGHANFQTTMNIYAGSDTDKMRESSLQLGAEYAQLASESCRKVAAVEAPQTLAP